MKFSQLNEITRRLLYSLHMLGLIKTIVLVSDDLKHNKVSVYLYMSYILEYLASKYPRVREIKVISDGAASQFKQRFLFKNLYVWKDLFSADLEWNFLQPHTVRES